jgi:hypothetical protein
MNTRRIESLKNQHSFLEKELAALKSELAPNVEHIQWLKRKKLCIKDQLAWATFAHQTPRQAVGQTSERLS